MEPNRTVSLAYSLAVSGGGGTGFYRARGRAVVAIGGHA